MKTYSVIVTLGNGLTEDWDIPEIVKNRLNTVANLYKQKIANKIVVSGKYSINFTLKRIYPPITESEVMKQFLIDQGIKETDIFKEAYSQDTIGNLFFTKKNILVPYKFYRILLICADFHLERVKILAYKIFGPKFEVDYKATPSESFKDQSFMKIQSDILEAQSNFLKPMTTGDDTYLEKRLYSDPYYQKKRPEKGALMAMRGVK